MKSLNIMLKSLFGIIMVALLAGVWVGPAAAAAPDLQDDQPNRRGARLEYGLKLALLRVDALQDHIDNTTDLADLAEERIADEQEAGRDTSALENALADFRSRINEAQTLRDEAAQILDDKAGFDAEGKVTDPEQARDTLRDAGQTMVDSGKSLRRARQDFRQAVRRYNQSKRTDRS